MTRPSYAWVSVVVLLLAVYGYHLASWLRTPVIQIVPQLRPPRFPGQDSPTVYQVAFQLDQKYRLTSVKVIPVAALETNKHPVPAWHLVGASRSLPQKGFLYGMAIPGMKPGTAPAQPQALLPDTDYRLLVEAGRARGQVDFRTRSLAE